ncbi:GNAT family protein [Tissierella sp. MB52-C2]|uniref:GNAT family N-acetyltransferase n=1 Tax=Tissierella sp. MB52-C2 TaxID=3070999 RepID=UPI00280C0FAC|nr:GNAT family protein [Tissierella sp. MB52-C2]WMM27012.1 GNAT family protein [Tissierella sp. MB52-C2]
MLRDYIITDIEDDIRWMTTEVQWHDWDAPWEAEEQLLKFNPDEFREKQIKRLKKVRSSGILRTSFEICTKDGVHIGGCNSYLIDDKYEWIPNTKDNKGYRTLGIDICEKSYWNKGFGTQVLVALINYYIDHEINEIYTQTWSGNHRMVNLAKRIGFVECECLENSVLVRGNMYDGLTFKLDMDRYKDFYNRLISNHISRC